MWIPFQPKMHCLNYYVFFEDGWHADSTRKCTIFYKETQKIHLFFLRVSYGSKTRVNHVTKVRTKKIEMMVLQQVCHSPGTQNLNTDFVLKAQAGV